MENKPVKLPEAEVTISTEMKYEGKIITLQVDQVRLPSGRIASREIVRHPGAAAVIALLDGKLLTVGQYRKPMDKYQVEIPAGKLDPERIQPSARRGNCGRKPAVSQRVYGSWIRSTPLRGLRMRSCTSILPRACSMGRAIPTRMRTFMWRRSRWSRPRPIFATVLSVTPRR